MIFLLVADTEKYYDRGDNMFCSNCGAQVNYDARFCPECGTAAGGEYAAPGAGAPQYGAPPVETPYYAPPSETPTYGAPSAEIPYYPEPPSDATVYVHQPAEPVYTPPSYAQPVPTYTPPDAPPSYAQQQTPPEGAGKKKNILKIIIPIGAAVLLLAAFACIYFFTDLLPFGPNRDDPSKKTTIVDDDEPTPTPRPTRTPTPPPVSNPLSGNGGEIRVTGATEYKFTPNSTGLWEFSTSENGGSDPYLELYDSFGDILMENDDGAGDYNALILYDLDEGFEYTINVGFYEDDRGDASCLLTVKFVDAYTEPTSAYDALPSSGGEVRVNGMTEYDFTPDRTGYWEFRTSANGDSDPTLLIFETDYTIIDSDDDSGEDGNALLNVRLEAGKTYYVIAGFYSDPASYTLTVKFVGDTSVNLTPDDSIESFGGMYGVYMDTLFKFIPNETGIWELRTFDNVECDPYLVFYNSTGDVISEDDEGGGKNNALVTVYIQGGETYYVKAGLHGGSGGGYLLKVQQCETIPENGGKMRVDAATVFLFSPGQSGTWEFRTSNNGDVDPLIRIYDLVGNYIADDDDGGGDKNALITTELSSETLYLVYMDFFDNIETNGYDLTVTRK